MLAYNITKNILHQKHIAGNIKISNVSSIDANVLALSTKYKNRSNYLQMPLKAPKNLYLDSLTAYLKNGRPLILSLVLLLNKQLEFIAEFSF